jgi:hypothetical protein
LRSDGLTLDNGRWSSLHGVSYVLYTLIRMSTECFLILVALNKQLKLYTTFNNGSLGSRIDEERSEMR